MSTAALHRYVGSCLVYPAPRWPGPRSPLSRLAVQAQGAPLIQQGGRRPTKPPQDPANAENTLPRIIKPRKRRKKDRKPQEPPPQPPAQPSGESQRAATAIVTLEPYTPLCYEAVAEEEPREETSSCQCRVCDPAGVWSPELEVSSQIVTSPNGQRDIEIKFFTSRPPPPPPPRPVAVSPPWSRPFKPEE